MLITSNQGRCGQDLSAGVVLCSVGAYRADGMAAENKKLREKVSALEKEIQGAVRFSP